MEPYNEFHDPLTMNITRQTRVLLSTIHSSSPYAATILNASTQRDLLANISRLLAKPALTLSIAIAFRPLLLPLCAQWLHDEGDEEEKLVALCLLIQPHEELFPVLSELLQKRFTDGPLAFVLTSPSLVSIDTVRLHRLLLAYYRILLANRELPHYHLWPVSPLAMLFGTPHPDTGVRLLSIRCYALQTGMGEGEREILEKDILGNICDVDCQIEYGQDLFEGDKNIDGWVLPAFETKRIVDARNAIVSAAHDYYGVDPNDANLPIPQSDLSTHVANIHGILLLRPPSQAKVVSPLIHTPNAIQSLRTLATHISLRLPILLTSPPSSGKSLLLYHLASSLHPGVNNQIVIIHLADTSLDPRSLLGAYISSTTHPGTFEWNDGILVRAMKEGKWVVFKDIDKGSSEILGIIKPLVESLRVGKWIGGRASLEEPSRGRIQAHPDFALFATRSLAQSRTTQTPPPVFLGARKFHEVVIHSPTNDELITIISSRFPRLAGTTAKALIRLWEAVRAHGSQASAQDVGLRELERFCARVENILPVSHQTMDISCDEDGESFSAIFPNPTIREDILIEARDVFFGGGTITAVARARMDVIAVTVAEHLGLEPDRRDWVLQGRIPTFQIEKDANDRVTAVFAGTARFPARLVEAGTAPLVARHFVMHKPAISLLSRIITALSLHEPVLLTGETATGKTSAVTYLASLLRRHLVSLNLSHQSESSDLIGGFKPVDARIPGSALQERFLELFERTFSRRKNPKFEEVLRKAVLDGRWNRAIRTWKEAARLAREKLQAKQSRGLVSADAAEDENLPRKRIRIDQIAPETTESNWNAFEGDVNQFEVQHIQAKGRFAFSFVEGPLVKALRSGDWVLLDEINLATPETLECISGLLHNPTSSITLTEQGSLEPVPRHPDFRLFACMNPANDVGKKDLPPHIRSRFTEIDVPPADTDRETLLGIITQYIGPCAVGDKAAIMNVAEFYFAVKKLAEKRQIADRSNHTPHYNLRTLVRALTFSADMASTYGLRRSLWEGCLMAFTMVLDTSSAAVVTATAETHLLAGVRNPRSMFSKQPSIAHLNPALEFIKFGPFYLEKGPLPAEPVSDYVITPSVERKLVDLARIVTTRRFPVLIEGPTSSGKTSSVEYLARKTGHHFIRINNHEHTDIQEYVGTYVPDPTTGKLVFRDGLLVRALRNGDWIVLDELNLAPTDVLEALNRLLDDNRELVVPETQEVVRPHPHFMLFATQNPPGLYAGRKVLSRAFRSRFLEVHFEDVPQGELEFILCEKCRIAPSYCQRIVNVFRELQKRRQSARIFESKHGFATLRDLFRWAGRDAVGYQELAENGYMLLAERTRREDDKMVVKEVIESEMKVKIDERILYNIRNPTIDYSSFLGCHVPSSSHLVWTFAMQRLFVLVTRALRFNEPVLLVGETGSGKTSVCQVYAETVAQDLYTLNCHQNTETADLIGGLRPVRNRTAARREILREVRVQLERMGINGNQDETDLIAAIDTLLKTPETLTVESRSRLEEARQKLLQLATVFEWRDGPLLEAMRRGGVFLLDEISLADDSVLERLNSVLEPARTIILSERGGNDVGIPAVQAVKTFKLVATMNPGGDYGKKELSTALRNRFTEIWVPPVTQRSDLELIVDNLWKFHVFGPYTAHLLDFGEWLCTKVTDRSLLSLRDIIACVAFSNSAYRPEDHDNMPPDEIFHHAIHMTFLDGLLLQPQLAAYSPDALQRLKAEALSKLNEIAPRDDSLACVVWHDPKTTVRFGPFAIRKGPCEPRVSEFNLQATSPRDNVVRVVRACQLSKPILLEGSPGVGKTALIIALANIAGHALYRINLSDQTDLIDLFGSDLPAEGGQPGEFAWRDAEFLKALQEGHWVLLDEMNLAQQAVLEGLNAVLDHRGTAYIPELGRSFTCHPDFRIFAAQNPLHQGGGRKGLPKSFVDRFTKVYLAELSDGDLLLICQHLFPDLDMDVLRNMITYNTSLNDEIRLNSAFAREGAPWEFNLRDVIRWASLVWASTPPRLPVEFLPAVYLHRFRNIEDRNRARLLFEHVFPTATIHLERIPYPSISSNHLRIGHFDCGRRNFTSLARPGCILQAQLPILESVGLCVSQSWPAIIIGPSGCGKTELVRTLASLAGHKLTEISFNGATDTMDILGSFEQINGRSCMISIARQVLSLINDHSRSMARSKLLQSDNYRLLQAELHHSPTLISPSHLLQVTASLAQEVHADSDLSINLLKLIGKIEETTPFQDGDSRFEWVDGPLIHAMKKGDWVFIDGANLCNPSVLDRLNSLCEPNGVVILSERGFVDGHVQTLHPHPDFRLFMSVDPQYGELSRAMRNRGIQIVPLNKPTIEDWKRLQHHVRLPETDSRDVDLGALAINFEVIRRGLVTPRVPANPSGASWLSGHPVDHDSPLSNVIGYSPSLSVVSSPSLRVSDPLLHFLARIVAPAYFPYVDRFLSALNKILHVQVDHVQGFLQSSHSQLVSTTASLRQEYSRSQRMTPEFIFTQPADCFLNCIPCMDCNVDLGSQSTHRTMVQILNICVELFIDESEMVTSNGGRASEMRGTIRQGYADGGDNTASVVEAILQAIPAASRAVLDNWDHDNLALSSGDFDLASKLLRYTRPLRAAVRNGLVDYSVIQAFSKLMSQDLRQCSPKFAHLFRCVKMLEGIISSWAGNGLTEIWSAFLMDRSLRVPEAQLTHLDINACSLKETANSYELRKQAFELMTFWSIPATVTDKESIILSNLTEQVQRSLTSLRAEDTCISRKNNNSYLLADLSVLSGVSGFQGVTIPKDCCRRIEELIDLACENPHGSLIRLTSYRHLLWAANAGSAQFPSIAQLQKEWLISLWNTEPQDNNAEGPQMLFRPTQLCSTMQICDWTRKPLSSLIVYEASIYRHVRLTFLLAESPLSRTEQLTVILQQSLLMIASCFMPPFNESVGQIMRELDHDCQAGAPVSLDRILAVLERSTNEPFLVAMQRFLHPSFRQFADQSLSRRQTIVNLGSCWVSLGRLIISLYVPDKPIDPAVGQYAILESFRREEANLSSQIHLHSQFEQRTTGNENSNLIAYLNACLGEVSENMPASSSHHSQNRRNLSPIRTFWIEVSQFLTRVISPAEANSFLFSDANDETASRREHLIQQSIAAFCQRLDVVNPEYADISGPLQLALLYIRLGMRLMASPASSDSNANLNTTERISTALISFPVVRSTAALLAEPETSYPSGEISCRYLLLRLAAIGLERSLGVDIENQVPLVETTYDQILRLWLIDRARETDTELASQSLYRHKHFNGNAVGDAEVEEQELLALFPQFEDVLQQDSPSPVKDKRLIRPLVELPHILKLVFIHYNIFSTTTHPSESRPDALIVFEDIRRLELESLSDGATTFSDTLDAESLSFQFTLLQNRLSELRGVHKSTVGPYNFYMDSNIVEIKKASAIVEALKKRLDTLVQEWSDQMVLQHLRNRCDLFLQLDLHSPLAKILAALEQLLTQSEDWELYANRENTLKEHQRAITGLIVDWRRLELSSWQGLLQAQAKSFADGTSYWWFRIYDVAIRGSLDVLGRESQDTNDFTNYLHKLIPLLDDFIRSSPLGQYHARMRLLQSFATYASHLARSKLGCLHLGLERVWRILQTTFQYYDLFSTSISRHLTEQQTLIEKEIQGFIKLASWKDVNIHALKQSAQKTHRQLYKCIRRFRDVMRQPVVGWFQPEFAGDAESKPLVDHRTATPHKLPAFPDRPSNGDLPNYLLDLNRTFQKFDALINGGICTFIASRPAGKVDDLAVDIILTAKSMSTLLISGGDSVDTKTKRQKALLVRKRKAWSDLLRELKRVGFSTNVKSDVLSQQSDVCWIREQPLISNLPTAFASVQRGETYYRRLQGSLPELRKLLSDHHCDITTRELQRGMALLESGFFMALDARSSFASALKTYEHLDRLHHRLKMTYSSANIVFFDLELPKRVSHMKDILSKLSHALDEVQHGMRVFNELHLSEVVALPYRDEVHEMSATTKSFLDKVSVLADHVKLTDFSFLLDQESALLSNVLQYLRHISSSLRQLLEQEPHLRHLLHPVHSWLDAQELPVFAFSKPQPTVAQSENPDSIIEAMLISVQGLLATCSTKQDFSTDRDYYIREDHLRIRDVTCRLNLGKVFGHLNSAVPRLCTSPDTLHSDLGLFLPFVDRYMELVEDQLIAHGHWMKVLFKLVYVLCSVIHSVAKQGFCRPPDTDDAGPGGDALETGGVGLGEGSGSESINKEIEDESQVEGLQGDTCNPHEPQEHDANDEALEISEEISGDLEDVPGTQEEDEDKESQVDPEEKLAKLDPLDPSAVDEKLWGDEEGPADQAESEKINKDRSKGDIVNSEVVAKEGPEAVQDLSDDINQSDKPDEMSVPEENNGSEHAGGAPVDDYIQDADTLDLPENMDLDLDLDLGGETDENNQCEDGEEMMEDGGQPEPVPDKDETGVESNEDDQFQTHDMDVLQQNQETGDEDDMDLDDADHMAVAKPDTSIGRDSSTNECHNPESGEATASDNNIRPSGATEHDSKVEGENNDHESSSASEVDRGEADTDFPGSTAIGPQRSSKPLQVKKQPSTNPLRDLGDALKEVRKRFEEIQCGEDGTDPAHEYVGNSAEISQVEYTRPDDVDYELQALGPAGEEQVAKLNELKIMDEIEEVSSMDLDLPSDRRPESLPQNAPACPEPIPDASHRNTEGAITQSDILDRHTASPSNSRDPSIGVFETGVNNVEDGGDVELELRKWQTAGQPNDGAEYMWRLYESLTHNLAYALCEQLRLILEPTRATRLRGDYRTGKRLNMKRVISYIASDYSKDKIWLRRTRPSQREYQILIALDDSRSMAESHSIHLAYQTLALVSRALTRLEVGDIAIVKFGEAVDILHGFDDGPFADRAGTKVMEAFGFNQKATNVLSLVEASLEMLRLAREHGIVNSSSVADLWQLEIIISDGICQDHEHLRAALRKAEEHRVMIVFIIIDSLHSTASNSGSTPSIQSNPRPIQNSILSMQQAAYKNIDGRMELHMQHYLDSFPFEYYVVLRDVEALPEVLSGTLRQFFERISEE